jgi:protein involved in polysaccharide export with SLBB domain
MANKGRAARAVFGACLLIVSAALTASAQSDDPLQAIKDSLGNGQDNGGLLQGVLGNGTQNGTKKTDKKLENPETVYPPQNQDFTERNIKTRDGRILRQFNEDPELRPDDSVMIEIRSIDDICQRANLGPNALQNAQNPNNPQIPPSGGVNPAVAGNPLNSALSSLGAGGTAGAASLGALGAQGGAAGLNGASPVNGINGIGGIAGYNQNANGNNNTNWFDLSRCPLPTDKPKTDEEKADQEKFEKRILAGNPYKLNRFGVIEVPGLPATPISGLTASEATKRLAADPDLNDYFVRMTLLRLTPTGDAALKPFGYDLFEGSPTTFAPVSDIQVPVDYIVGPGDSLVVQLYGNEPATYELTVERDGRINFPKIGPIMVSGMTFDAARDAIEQRVSKQLIGSRVSVTIGDLRSIRVFVLGEAQKPGSYTVSGLSTMTNALFVSGGVKKIGSLRNIQLKRDGRLIATLDLYDMLLRGDNSGDHQLLPNDVIFIPPVGETVSVYGAVRRPAIYELKGEKTAEQVIQLAGGLQPDADPTLGQLERISQSHVHQMHNIDLAVASGRALVMENGDKLKIPEIRPTLENSVKLEGYVFRPGAFAYHPGLRLSDVLSSFEEVRPEADLHYIMIRRVVPPDLKVEVISADLRKALLAKGSAADPELHPRDEITVFNLSSTRARIVAPIIRDLELQATPDKPEQVVNIDGRVKAPGKYPLEPSMHVSDLIRAGGSLEDAAFRGQAELTRYAVVDGNARRTELINVDLAAIRRGDKAADLPLRPYDTLVIKPIPSWMEPGTIEVAGEVRFPGKYPIHQGETLHSVMVRAGGFTETAFPEGAVFVREDLKKREKDQIEILAARLQNDLAALSLEAVASSAAVAGGGGGGGAAAASQGLIVGQQLLGELRETKPVGRLVIDAEGILNGKAGGPFDVIVKDGDKLIIPKKTQDVTILGEVQSPTSHVYEPGLSRDDYIQKSGGTTQHADHKRIYVVRANGDVVARGGHGWFRRTHATDIRPGDTIVVPLDTQKVPALPLVQAITTIIYNLAIGFILIHTYL